MIPTLLAITMLLGHLSAWTWIYNRLHASGLSSRFVRQLEKWVILACLATGGSVFVWLVLRGPVVAATSPHWPDHIMLAWQLICWMMLTYVLTGWLVRRIARREPGPLVANDTQCLDVARILGRRPIGRRLTRMWGAIPGNQILHIQAHHKIVRMPNLPPALAGLRIAHVSDLHMTGQLTREFFDIAFAHLHTWKPDLIAITGDLVDEPACFAWIPATLGQLACPFGIYAVLGNHDQRLADVARLRQTLTDSGIEDLGGRCVLRTIRDVPVRLAGNEQPWFPAAQLPAAQPGALDRATPHPFSILLSHSPDQLPWARRHGFQLMLAGHTHGGQIRLPGIGPIICPSRYGVWYASGLFDRPPTLLHVSRGLSGVHPLRFNCPPEVTLLELRNP